MISDSLPKAEDMQREYSYHHYCFTLVSGCVHVCVGACVCGYICMCACVCVCVWVGVGVCGCLCVSSPPSAYVPIVTYGK